MTQEFLVLATQYLTELRDAILCVEDDVSVGEYSQNPDLPRGRKAKVSVQVI